MRKGRLLTGSIEDPVSTETEGQTHFKPCRQSQLICLVFILSLCTVRFILALNNMINQSLFNLHTNQCYFTTRH